MSKETYIRTARLVAGLQLFPNTIREALISDYRFIDRYGVVTDAVFAFGSGGIRFKRSLLLETIRRSFALPKTALSVMDISGKKWRIEILTNRSLPEVALRRGKERLLVSDFALLSPDRRVRMKVFHQKARHLCLLGPSRKRWGDLLRARPPNDDELGTIHDDLILTPIAMEGVIRGSLTSNAVLLDAIIPRSQEYYERLIGRCDDDQSFEAFVAGSSATHMRNLLKWNRANGYRLILLLGAQPKISSVISRLRISRDDLAKVIEDLVTDCDALSRVTAIEVGLAVRNLNANLKRALARLFRAIIASVPIARVDPYELLSSLITLTYGEIAYTRSLASKPPFWRRLAAIAQATLIARCIAAVKGDARKFLEVATKSRLEIFVLQCLVDLRQEPRWIPELLMPEQLKNELGGRILLAAASSNSLTAEPELHDLLFGETGDSLVRQLNFAQCLLPGPLEGNIVPIRELQPDQIANIRSELSQPIITCASFSNLVNAVFLYRIPGEIIDVAADALNRAAQFLTSPDGQQLEATFRALAVTSAITRNLRLADALFVSLRNHRIFQPEKLDIDTSLYIAVAASASREDLMEWCACVGERMNELAFQKISRDDAARLHSRLTLLCHLVPELWATCGSAEAALQSILHI